MSGLPGSAWAASSAQSTPVWLSLAASLPAPLMSGLPGSAWAASSAQSSPVWLSLAASLALQAPSSRLQRLQPAPRPEDSFSIF